LPTKAENVSLGELQGIRAAKKLEIMRSDGMYSLTIDEAAITDPTNQVKPDRVENIV
jgi:hypothetical protein